MDLLSPSMADKAVVEHIANKYGLNAYSAASLMQLQKTINDTKAPADRPAYYGVIDATTWKAVGLKFNSNLQEQFGHPNGYYVGGNTVRMAIKENTIEIRYSPKFYFDSSLCMTDKEKQTFIDNAIEGVKRWAGSYEVYGISTTINVTVDTPVTVKTSSESNIYVKKGDVLATMVSDAVFWSKSENLGITVRYEDKRYAWDAANLIQHEFGHVLGLFDAYSYEGNIPGIGTT